MEDDNQYKIDVDSKVIVKINNEELTNFYLNRMNNQIINISIRMSLT